MAFFGVGTAGTIRYNPDTDWVQIYDGTTWHNWRNGGLKSYWHVRSVSTTSGDRRIAVDKLGVGGAVIETTELKSGTTTFPVFFGNNAFKIYSTNSNNTWNIERIAEGVKYNNIDDRGNAQTFANLNWAYSTSASYYIYE